jgi:hypothetical protein
MRLRAAPLATVAAAVWLAAAGCRRSPLADARDAPADLGGGDSATLDGSAHPGDGSPADSDTRADGPSTVDATDAPADLPGSGDRPADLATGDAPTDRVPIDRTDGPDARPEEQPCGPLGFYCAPFACDVARGICKSVCATDDDCTSGRPCRNGSCGGNDRTPCSSNSECNSGFCAQGTCCNTVCNQVCFSCALPATIGVCTPLPAGALEPLNRCGEGNFCDGTGGCTTPSCATDDDCAVRRNCTAGHCVACTASCVSDADCAAVSYCVKRNGCSYCWPRDLPPPV